MHYPWRAVDQEGEILESYVTKTRDKQAALRFMKKALKRHGSPETITANGLRSYKAAMAHDVPRLAIGSDIDQVEVGIRLRCAISRELAPYIGIEQSWRVEDSAHYARARGEHPSVTNYVLGIRFWF